VLLFGRGVTTQVPFSKLPATTATPTAKRNSRIQTKRNLPLSIVSNKE
jgi:hypothetical protein